MEDRDLLDRGFESPEIVPPGPVAQWEKLRIWYNLALVLIILLVCLSYREGTTIYGVSDAIIHSAIVVAIANVCYTLGAGLEVTLMHYFDKYRMHPVLRLVVFGLGTFFSVALAWEVYANTLQRLMHYESF